MTGRTILMFGVSGVGKTTAARAYCDSRPDTVHVRASALLSAVTGEPPEMLRTSAANRILANQWLLADALKHVRADHPDRILLVDAHATIFNGSALVRFPVEVIAAMRANALLLLELSADQLLARRAADVRDRPDLPAPMLATQLIEEREAVFHYARRLHLPLEVIQASVGSGLDDAIDLLKASIPTESKQA